MQIDRDVIKGCIKKDRVSQKALYTLLMPYLNPVCRRYLYNPSDLQDALQVTFIQLFLNIKKYDSTKSQFQTWAVRIAINTSLKINKKMNRMETIDISDQNNFSTQEPYITSQLDVEELLQFLKAMPKKYFVVFSLHAIDGYSHKEISEMLGIDESNSRQRMSRARGWIKERTNNEALIKRR